MVASTKKQLQLSLLQWPKPQTLHPIDRFMYCSILLSKDTREENTGFLDLWIMCFTRIDTYVHVHVPCTKSMQAEMLLMDMLNVGGYVVCSFTRTNHFSYDGTQLLKERAKSIRPGMRLYITALPTTDDDNPPTMDHVLH